MIVLISSADFRPFIRSLSSPIRNDYRDRTFPPMGVAWHFLHGTCRISKPALISAELTTCRNCHPASQKFVFPATRKFIIVKNTAFWKFTDVSEVSTASIFSIEDSDDPGIINTFPPNIDKLLPIDMASHSALHSHRRKYSKPSLIRLQLTRVEK
jgi:hypothetical protein